MAKEYLDLLTFQNIQEGMIKVRGQTLKRWSNFNITLEKNK